MLRTTSVHLPLHPSQITSVGLPLVDLPIVQGVQAFTQIGGKIADWKTKQADFFASAGACAGGPSTSIMSVPNALEAMLEALCAGLLDYHREVEARSQEVESGGSLFGTAVVKPAKKLKFEVNFSYEADANDGHITPVITSEVDFKAPTFNEDSQANFKTAVNALSALGNALYSGVDDMGAELKKLADEFERAKDEYEEVVKHIEDFVNACPLALCDKLLDHQASILADENICNPFAILSPDMMVKPPEVDRFQSF